MVNLKNFKVYIPDDEDRAYLVEMGIAFYVDDVGNDWYLSQKKYRKDTLKIAYFPDGKIDSFDYDVSALVPVGLSVGEVRKGDIPEGFPNSGKWLFDGETITAYQPTQDELISSAASMKATLMEEARDVIAPLHDAVDLDIANDAETAQLQKWKNYRVLLSRVNTSLAPDITWPPVPDIIL